MWIIRLSRRGVKKLSRQLRTHIGDTLGHLIDADHVLFKRDGSPRYVKNSGDWQLAKILDVPLYNTL